MTATLPDLPPDVYRVSWRTLSSDDLHETSGVLVFGVQRKVVAAGPPPEPRPRPGEAALRWLGFLAAGGLLGGLLLAALARGRDEGRAPARVAAWSGVAAAVLGAGLLAVQAGGVGHALTGTPYGPRWLVREAALVVLVAVAVRHRAGRAGRATIAVEVIATGALGLASALLGHAGATASTRPGRVLLDALHLLAVLGWVGGVLVLALLVAPALRRPDRRCASLRLVRAFSPAAVGCAAAAVVTGLALAGTTVASLDALLLSLYGRILLTKVLLVAAAAALAVRTATQVRHGGAATPRAIRLEAAGLAAVLAAAAALTAAQPALGPRWQRPTAVTAPLASGRADDLVETITVKPNLPGPNVVDLGVFDSRRPAPGPVTGVGLRLTSPDGATTITLPAQRASDGRWTVSLDGLTVPGRWRVTVTAIRPGLRPATATYDWVVGDPALRAPVWSNAPLAPTLDRLALLALAGILTGLGLVVIRRRLRRPTPAAAADFRDAAPSGGAPDDGDQGHDAQPPRAGSARDVLAGGPGSPR